MKQYKGVKLIPAKSDEKYCSGWASLPLCEKCKRQTAKYSFSTPATHNFIYRGDRRTSKCENFVEM